MVDTYTNAYTNKLCQLYMPTKSMQNPPRKLEKTKQN